MTALTLILIVAGAMLAVGLLTVLAWLIYTSYLDRVERNLAARKSLYRDLVTDLATRDQALLRPTIHKMSTLYDLDALEAVLEEQARGVTGRAGWLLEVYDELGLIDKYIDQLRSARKWRDRAFAAELLGRVGGAKAVPALLETVAATRTEDADVREVSLRALARIGDPQAVAPLIRALETADAWLAPRIADILARHGEAAIDPLIHVLDSGDHQPTRAWAANVLGEVRAQRAFPSLVRLLGDSEDEVRGKAATALGRLGDRRAVGYLLEHLLADPAPFVRVRIAVALGQLGGPEVIERLVRALGDQAWWVRLRSVEALEQIGGLAEAPLLIALDDPDPEIRLRAAVALERLGVPDNLVRMIEIGDQEPEAHETLVKLATTGTREFLAEQAQHPSRQIRGSVIAAIERAQRRDLADELIQIAGGDSDPSLRAQAFAALRSLAVASAAPVARGGLSDPDPGVRAEAVRFLSELGDPDAVPLLRAQTADPDATVRATAVHALAALGAETPDADIRRLLTDPHPSVRQAAATLATLGKRSVVPLLLRAFPDSSSEVSEAIARAVSRLDLPALGGLVDAVADSSDVESKVSLVRTLSRSGADAVPVLLRLRADYFPAVRGATIAALGSMARRGWVKAEAATAAIESGLKDPDESVRATAVDACGSLAHTGCGKDLLGLLREDVSPLVRERAALAVALLRLPEGEDAVIAACRRAEPANVRAAAVLAAAVYDRESIVSRVMEMPDSRSVRALLQQRLHGDPRFRLLRFRLSRGRHLELRALGSPADAEAQTSLAKGMRGILDAEERVRLIGSLRAFHGEQSASALLEILRSDPTPEVRTAAITALAGLLDPDELLSTGSRALGDPSVMVRRAAVALFTKVSPERALPRLIQVLRVDDDPAVLAAVAKLAEERFPEFAATVAVLPAESQRAVLVVRIARHIVHPDLPAIIPAFARSSLPEVRAAVADLWRNCPDIADGASLEALVLDPETIVRRIAAEAAFAAERYDLLDTMTQDPDSSIRREVALVLGRGAPVQPAGLAILERLAADHDMAVRAAAYVARLLQGLALPLPPELDGQVAAQALSECADLPGLRQAARTESSEERRLAAALALALLQDDVAKEVARTDPAPAIRHRVSGALDLSMVGLPGTSS